jgi:hypothetical protein
MNPSDFPAAVFVHGWLIILAAIQRSLCDDALEIAIKRTAWFLSSDPRFEVSATQAIEMIGSQVLALTDHGTDPKVRAFAIRCLKVLVREAVSEN